MKTLKFAVVAGLALASSFVARAEMSAQAWLECYYLDPQPADLAWQVQRLSDSGYFEQPGHVALAIGFLGTVFARNPERVDEWLRQLNKLPSAHQRLLAAALWQAGDPRGSDLLRKLNRASSVRERIDFLADVGTVSIAETPVLSPSSMNLHWGAFLASGDERYILSILDAIGTNRPGLDAAARTALAQNAAAHPRVQEICQAQLTRQPEEVRSVLRAALTDAAAIKPRS